MMQENDQNSNPFEDKLNYYQLRLGGRIIAAYAIHFACRTAEVKISFKLTHKWPPEIDDGPLLISAGTSIRMQRAIC